MHDLLNEAGVVEPAKVEVTPEMIRERNADHVLSGDISACYNRVLLHQHIASVLAKTDSGGLPVELTGNDHNRVATLCTALAALVKAEDAVLSGARKD